MYYLALIRKKFFWIFLLSIFVLLAFIKFQGKEEKKNDVIQNIQYYKHTKTNVCFAVITFSNDSKSTLYVPCSVYWNGDVNFKFYYGKEIENE